MPFPLLAAAIPSIIGAAGSIGGAAIGSAAGAGSRAAQQRLIESILRDYGDLSVPELEKVLAEQLGSSAQEGVRDQMDPRVKNEQMDVLNSLKRLEDGGGESAETRAVLNRILGETQRSESAGRNAILGNMRARGTSGSGAELAMQLNNNQQQAERAQSAGLEQSAQANRRLLETIMGRGRMAGDMRGQDYRELSDAARAKDMISQYNADARSKSNYYNGQLPAQQYGMQLQKLAGKSNAATNSANMYGANAQSAASQGAAVGTGVGNAGAAFAGKYLEDEEKKKNGGL